MCVWDLKWRFLKLIYSDPCERWWKLWCCHYAFPKLYVLYTDASIGKKLRYFIDIRRLHRPSSRLTLSNEIMVLNAAWSLNAIVIIWCIMVVKCRYDWAFYDICIVYIFVYFKLVTFYCVLLDEKVNWIFLSTKTGLYLFLCPLFS